MRIDVWHNVIWSRYKGRVFSALHRLASSEGEDVRFVQMAETEGARIALGSIDLSYHSYPYELLYKGSIENVSKLRSMPYFFWRALTTKADLVVIAGFSHAQDWAQLAGLMLRRTPRAVFCDSTAADRTPSLPKYLAKRFFFRRCHVVLCYGQRSRDYVLHHGVEPDRVMTRCQAAALPDDYRVDDVPALRAARRSADPRLLYTGRLSPEKNLSTLLAAFARYVGTRPNARLRLVGDGPSRKSLEEEAARLQIADKVVFTGGIDQRALADEYLSATCLVLPSTSEPWGLVVNEALSYGCPVIVSSACGCTPELVDARKTGFVFDPDSVDELYDRLVRIEAEFADPDVFVPSCLELISSYSPEAAASQILHAARVAYQRATAR